MPITTEMCHFSPEEIDETTLNMKQLCTVRFLVITGYPGFRVLTNGYRMLYCGFGGLYNSFHAPHEIILRDFL